MAFVRPELIIEEYNRIVQCSLEEKCNYEGTEPINKNSEYFPQFYKYYIYQTNEVKYLTASAADKLRGIWPRGSHRMGMRTCPAGRACGNKLNVKKRLRGAQPKTLQKEET